MIEKDPQPVERIEVAETPVERIEVQVTEAPAPEVVVPVGPVIPRKVYGGMWGKPEIVAAAGAAMLLLLVSIIYMFFVVPSDRELARNKSEIGRLDAELASANSKYGEITSTETQVQKLLSSVDNFQMAHLPVAASGQSALYQKINSLILGYGLINTTGPDYAPLETGGGNGGESDEERGRAKFRSLFPGVYVTMTVEGPYQNLRRFLREIETGRDFIIVSAVELAPSDNEGRPQTVRPAKPMNPNQPMAVQRPKGKVHGENVSLHIELAAYFRRPAFVPMTPAQAVQ
jgi:hypothetical protein